MVTMTTNTGWPFAGYPFTIHDLDRMPDDGRRYEILDGALIVSPRPIVWHQKVAFMLARVLDDACPQGLDVIPEPAVALSDITEFDPDIVVIHRRQLADARLIEPPLLVVEVRSPSTAVIDVTRKKAAYEKFGVPSYWIIDPDRDRPELTVFELGPDGSYLQAARVAGPASFPARKPFEVEIVPARLVAGLFPR
jgi:Uma2 family endonuclease